MPEKQERSGVFLESSQNNTYTDVVFDNVNPVEFDGPLDFYIRETKKNYKTSRRILYLAFLAAAVNVSLSVVWILKFFGHL